MAIMSTEQHGPFCALCGACKLHPDPGHPDCYDSANGRHRWNFIVIGCDLCGAPLPANPEDAYVLTDPMPAQLACERCAKAAR